MENLLNKQILELSGLIFKKTAQTKTEIKKEIEFNELFLLLENVISIDMEKAKKLLELNDPTITKHLLKVLDICTQNVKQSNKTAKGFFK